MPATLFVKIEGVKDLVGDSVEKNHLDWIVVESVEFGLERHQSDAEGGVVTRGFGKAVFNDVTFTSELGRHSMKLMLQVAGGKRLPTITIHQCKANEDDAVALEPYVIWTLRDTQVSSYNITSGSEEIPKENWAVRPSELQIDYYYPDNKGKGKLKKENEFKWDIGAGATSK